MDYHVVSIDDGSNQDATYYPVLGDADESIAPEQEDGPDPRTFPVTAVQVEYRAQGTWKSLFEARNIEAKTLLSDSRIAVVCKKYDKGGGWVGTPRMMLVANAISSVKAAKRTKGKHLVAQVRHEHCAAISFEAKTSWLTETRCVPRSLPERSATRKHSG